jgi:hypothetical protein
LLLEVRVGRGVSELQEVKERKKESVEWQGGNEGKKKV